jgi:phage terminase large subunit-like protein
MPKGRPADLELVSAEARAALLARAGGDSKSPQYKRELMHALRAAKKQRETDALTAIALAEPTNQLHFAGEEFDPALYDTNHKDELRRRCQTDLFFLCRDIFGLDVTERTHGPVFEFLGNPNPDLPLQAQMDPVRERIWLDPRGTFKTTLIGAYGVQWTICFPQIRILFLGGEKLIALASLDAYTETFVIRGEPTRFQRLFPEFCIQPNDKYEKKYVAPCRVTEKRRREPTAWSNSVDSALSGWHPDMLLPDDIENDENSETVDRVSKVKKIYYLAKKLLEPVHGRTLHGGTKYDKNGLNSELAAAEAPGKKILVRAAMWARRDLSEDRRRELEAALRDPNVPSFEFQEQDWELLFPERLSFAYLMGERGPGLEKFYAFCGQYLNDPTAAKGLATFTREALRAATVPAIQIPAQGRIFVWWDLAYKTKSNNDYFCGGVGLVDALERLFILEIVRGRFVTHQIVFHIVDLIRRWSPYATEVEDTNGARWLLSDLDRMAAQLGVALRVEWVPVDASPAAKDGRVKGSEALLHQKRLFFSANIACLEDLYDEFENYGRFKTDDIPDVISQLAMRHVRFMVGPGTGEEELGMDEQRGIDRRTAELHDMIFRDGEYTPREPEAIAPDDPYALEDAMPGLTG